MHKIIVLLFSIFVLSYGDTITITADEWCPYNCKQNVDNPGYMIEIARQIFQKEGHELIYVVNTSWDNAVMEAREGKYNAIVGAYKTDAPDFIYPENSQGISRNSFFTKKTSTWEYKDINSLNAITLGCIKGYSYGEELDNYIAKHKHNPKKVQIISGNRAIYQNAKKLLYDTINVIVEDENVLDYYFKLKGQVTPFKIAGYTVVHNIYIAFSPNNKNSKKYAEILSRGMEGIQKSGELDVILKKYGMRNWK